jgi:hypothetical protein
VILRRFLITSVRTWAPAEVAPKFHELRGNLTISDHLGVPVTEMDHLAEVHHGDFAGLTDEQIEERHPGEFSRRVDEKYRWAFPRGESYADPDRKAEQALADPGLRAAGRPLIVSHEMIVRMLRRHLLGIEPGQALASKHPHNVVHSPGPRVGSALPPAIVNGTVGKVATMNGRPFAVLALSVVDDRIVEITALADPKRGQRVVATRRGADGVPCWQ